MEYCSCIRPVYPRGVAHLFVPDHEVHEAVVVVVVVGRLGGVGGQHEVVGTQPVALRISVGEDARLQEFVVGVADARNNQGWAEGLLQDTPAQLEYPSLACFGKENGSGSPAAHLPTQCSASVSFFGRRRCAPRHHVMRHGSKAPRCREGVAVQSKDLQAIPV
jgi:hypothetical protein